MYQGNKRRLFRLTSVIALVGLLSVPLAKAQSPVRAVTTIYPLREWLEAVGGTNVQVQQLLPPGVEAHTYAPRPSDMLAIRKADLFVYLHPVMEPWAKDLLAGTIRPGLRILEAAEHIVRDHDDEEKPYGGHHEDDENEHEAHGAHSHHGFDPHVWLDPLLARQIVKEIAGVLSEIDPANREYYEARGNEYAHQLDILDQSIQEMLGSCERRSVVFVGHSAFEYFSRRYNLLFVTPYPDFSPNAAPGPRALADIVRVVRETKSRVIFHEELVVPRVAETLARETGARIEVLHAIHNLTDDEIRGGATYISLMKANAHKLKEALECR